MAVLHVDEVEAGLLGEHGGDDVVLGELVEFVVGEHCAAIHSDATIEDRVRVRGPWERRPLRA